MTRGVLWKRAERQDGEEGDAPIPVGAAYRGDFRNAPEVGARFVFHMPETGALLATSTIQDVREVVPAMGQLRCVEFDTFNSTYRLSW
jgi:hypothetical protein